MNVRVERCEAAGLSGLGERLYRLRVEGLLTLEDIGGLVGVNKTAVSKWERGVCLPAVQYVVLLCDLFDVTVEWLLEGRGRRSRRGGANG